MGVDTGPEKRFVRPLATLAMRPRDSEPAERRKAVGHNTLPGMVVADALIADATAAPVRRAGTTPKTLVAPSILKNLPVSSVAATAATTTPAARACSMSERVQGGGLDIRMMFPS